MWERSLYLLSGLLILTGMVLVFYVDHADDLSTPEVMGKADSAVGGCDLGCEGQSVVERIRREEPTGEELEGVLRDLPGGAFLERLRGLSKTERERVLRRIWFSPAITNNLNEIRIGSGGILHYACSGFSLQKFEGAGGTTNEVKVSAQYQSYVPISSPPALNSRPDSEHLIFLDFNGMVVSNTYWNNDLGYAVASWDTRPFSRDADETTFSPLEQQEIEIIWREVAADFEPFDVNVTTVDPGANPYFYHALITSQTDKNGVANPLVGVGGIAILGDPYIKLRDFLVENIRYYSPAWVNSLSYHSAKEIGLICSHELGHNFGLNHDGTSTLEYYGGHGGAISWGPIMGNPYDRSLTTWSRGDYKDANNTIEDDLDVLTYQFTQLPDEAGGEPVSAVALTPNNMGEVVVEGVITSAADVDVFRVEMPMAGEVALEVYPTTNTAYGAWGTSWRSSLNLQLRVLDEEGGVVVSNRVLNRLHGEASVSLAAGTYYIELDGVGSGDPLASSPSGFSDYGSVGKYVLSGFLPADTDGDGMPDGWEVVQLGSVAALPADDADGDGLSNLSEYIAGTDPMDEDSVLAVTVFDLEVLGRVLRWDGVVDRSYRVLMSRNLVYEPFVPISQPLLYPINAYTDAVERVDDTLFYRIEVSGP
jgi:hypothetical protein